MPSPPTSALANGGPGSPARLLVVTAWQSLPAAWHGKGAPLRGEATSGVSALSPPGQGSCCKITLYAKI